MSLSITFENALEGDYLVRALHQARGQLVNQDVTTSLGLALKIRNEARHVKEVDPDGKPWTPLKPYTIKHKTNPRMLVEKGDMLRLYSHPDHDSVTIGTADEKAYWHHHGTVWKPKAEDVESGKKNYFEHSTKHLPARPLVGFSVADKVFTVALIEDHIQAVLRGALHQR
ncbi:hypothetical protein JCM14076_06390 [Methylosoma difficile]